VPKNPEPGDCRRAAPNACKYLFYFAGWPAMSTPTPSHQRGFTSTKTADDVKNNLIGDMSNRGYT
jgi:hypothetical protein